MSTSWACLLTKCAMRRAPGGLSSEANSRDTLQSLHLRSLTATGSRIMWLCQAKNQKDHVKRKEEIPPCVTRLYFVKTYWAPAMSDTLLGTGHTKVNKIPPIPKVTSAIPKVTAVGVMHNRKINHSFLNMAFPLSTTTSVLCRQWNDIKLTNEYKWI